MPKIADTVEMLIRPVVEKMGLILWDIEFVKEGADYYLRIFIDSLNGIGIDDCERVSRAIDPILDEADPIDQGYILEVSSPGIERVLKRPADFERFMGSNVEIRLFTSSAGKKCHIGTLSGYSDENITIDSGGEVLSFEANNVSKVKIKYDFDN